MKLRPRFLLITAAFLLVVALPSWWAVRHLTQSLLSQWAQVFLERQTLYDQSRTLQPILREVALAQQMVASPALLAWAREPQDPQAQALGLQEAERYRTNFADGSYFVVIRQTGAYFHNNAANEFKGQELRYHLDPQAERDQWFFHPIEDRVLLHVNINHDEVLGTSKVWINALIRDGEQILGMAGTGLDLTAFVQSKLDTRTQGVSTLFMDHDGRIQLARLQGLIDGQPTPSPKFSEKKAWLAQVFKSQSDRSALEQQMNRVRSAPGEVGTFIASVQGREHLVGVSYLPELGWFNLTMLDLSVFLPLNRYALLLTVYGLTLAGLLLLFNVTLGRYVLRPLARLKEGIVGLEAGQASAGTLTATAGPISEIDDLHQHFSTMAKAVIETQRTLEDRVAERTQALETLSSKDVLTGLLNRRGMQQRLLQEWERHRRQGQPLGLLYVDVDRFKTINDRFGHAVGDLALQAVAQALQHAVRSYDQVSRWGGDEFLVLLQDGSQSSLDALGQRIVAEVRAQTRPWAQEAPERELTVSVGGYLCDTQDRLDDALAAADHAMLEAKRLSRDTYVSVSHPRA